MNAIADDTDANVTYKDEAIDYFQCVVQTDLAATLTCFGGIDLNTTCDDLKNGTFCTDVQACSLGECVQAWACEEKGKKLEECVGSHMPNQDGDEECPSLCEDEP